MLIILISIIGIGVIIFLSAQHSQNVVGEIHEEPENLEIESFEWLPNFSQPDENDWPCFEEVDKFLKEDLIYTRLEKYSYGYQKGKVYEYKY